MLDKFVFGLHKTSEPAMFGCFCMRWDHSSDVVQLVKMCCFCWGDSCSTPIMQPGRTVQKGTSIDHFAAGRENLGKLDDVAARRSALRGFG